MPDIINPAYLPLPAQVQKNKEDIEKLAANVVDASKAGGEWNAETTYPIGTIVTYIGSSYFALKTNTASPPTAGGNNEYWQLLANGESALVYNNIYYWQTTVIPPIGSQIIQEATKFNRAGKIGDICTFVICCWNIENRPVYIAVAKLIATGTQSDEVYYTFEIISRESLMGAQGRQGAQGEPGEGFGNMTNATFSLQNVAYQDGVATFTGKLTITTSDESYQAPITFPLPIAAGEGIAINANEGGTGIEFTNEKFVHNISIAQTNGLSLSFRIINNKSDKYTTVLEIAEYLNSAGFNKSNNTIPAGGVIVSASSPSTIFAVFSGVYGSGYFLQAKYNTGTGTEVVTITTGVVIDTIT